MIATKPLLSICIPTYNREKYLKRLIDSIVHQKGFTNEIEIVIDDGPSKDGTERLIKQYQQTYKNIRYFRNTKAVGMTASFLEAISLSNGKYTWLFGSDDFMYKNALEIVIDIIKSKSPTVILPNRLSFSDIEKCKEYKETDIKLLDFQGFSDFGIYLGLDEKKKSPDKWNYFTFISVFCFETDYYKKMLEYIENNICTSDEIKSNYFNFSLIIFAQLTADKKIYIIENPRMVFCQEYNHGRKLNKKISTDLKTLINYLENTYMLPKNCIKLLKKMSFSWWFSCYILGPIKNILNKVGLYEYALKIWKTYLKKSK